MGEAEEAAGRVSRRGLLRAAGVMPMAMLAEREIHAQAPSKLAPRPADGFSLSATNPVATAEQREIEEVALRLLLRPELLKAREVAIMLWRNAMDYPARDQASRFDAMIDEYMFHYAIRAANSDVNFPRVARFMAPPHRWFGRDVPGSRWAGDSPDFIYRMIPIAHGGRYELHGRQTCSVAPSVNYQLISTRASPVSLGLLSSLDMAPGADGSFVITIDETPAAGRPNHIQTRPGADHMMIRDALGDWMTQSANALRIVRLNPPERGLLSEEEIVRQAAQRALDGVYYAHYCTLSGSGQPPNSIRAPQSSGMFGGMPSQWSTKANLELADDEALIVTANAAGAQFRNVVLTDCFFLTVDYWSRTGSLNMNQMAADASGDFTYVVAHRDPGIHNWLDTSGLRRTIFGQRWQAIPADYKGETPRMATRLVKLKDLDKALPKGVQRIDVAGRRDQLAAREAGFKRRFADS